jgi:hypothetical protein
MSSFGKLIAFGLPQNFSEKSGLQSLELDGLHSLP